MKNFLLSVPLLFAVTAFAQSNFSYTPEKPKAGNEISFTYTPSGDLAGTLKIPEAFVIKDSSGWMSIENIDLKREYGKLSGKIKTDTSYTFVALSFKEGNMYDNNSDSGYLINLYDKDKVKIGSYAAAANFLDFYGPYRLNMKSNSKMAVKQFDKEFELYPENKEKYFMSYLSKLYRADKEKGSNSIQSEIEKMLRDTLKKRSDYRKVERLYGFLKLNQQSALMSRLKMEEGIFDLHDQDDFNEIVMKESDINKKEILLSDVKKLIANAPIEKKYSKMKDFVSANLARSYSSHKNWAKFREVVSAMDDDIQKYSLMNSAAWKMQEDSTNLELAEESSRQSVIYARTNLKRPSGRQPNMMTYKEWIEYNKNTYATYADTYAMVLYRMGNYKKALPYATEAAYAINRGQDVDQNKTYALIAERAMSPTKYKPKLEQFVKDGKSDATINDILKRLYIKQQKSEVGFDEYIAALEKEAHQKLVADLRKEMLNEPTPQFTLKDLAGNTVNIADLKGKTVVVDFWATWCGPCIASMPGMQKMVNKYKDNPGVKFLFIDTWQNEDNETELVQNFIEKRGYRDFHVLMDLDDKVVSSFKVEGIPTKFILGKDGNIKFKDVGFGGEESLLKKLPAMIELAN